MRDSNRLTESDGTPSSASGAADETSIPTRGHGTRGVSSALAEETVEPAPSSEPDSRDLVGQTIGKYEIVGLVGRGGMGRVYEAINTTIQKRVAMKVIDQELAKNDEATARFQREALAASAIESPQIVQIFDAGFTDGGTPFIVMELLRGRDLGDLLKEQGKLTPDEVLPIVAQILKGLHYAHEAGIVHRDLKPDNVYLCTRDDEPLRVKLLDFGVSKIARDGRDVPLQTLTRQGTVVGTPYYMSPEQAQAFPDVDGRTDIYSVGAILYECLAGRPPHIGKSYEQVIVNICMKDVVPVDEQNEHVGPELAAVVHKALSKEREDRFGSARDFLQALADIAPDSVRISSPSGSLKRISVPADKGSDSGARIVATPPNAIDASEFSDEFAATVQADKPVKHATIDRDEMEEALRRSGQSEKLRQSGTQAVSTVRTPELPVPRKKRRWTLALAPGIALVVGAFFMVQFMGNQQDAGAIKAGDKKVDPSDVAADPPDPTPIEIEPPAPSTEPAPTTSASTPTTPPAPAMKTQPPRPIGKQPAPVAPKAPAKPAPEPPTNLVAPPEPKTPKKPELKLQHN